MTKRTIPLRPETAAALDELAPLRGRQHHANDRTIVLVGWVEESLKELAPVDRYKESHFVQFAVDPKQMAAFDRYAFEQGLTRSEALRKAIDTLPSASEFLSLVNDGDHIPSGYQAHGKSLPYVKVFLGESQAAFLEMFDRTGFSQNDLLRAAIRLLVERERRSPTPKQSERRLDRSTSISLPDEVWRQIDEAALKFDVTATSIVREIIASKTAKVEADIFNRVPATPISTAGTLMSNNSVVRAFKRHVPPGERSAYVREALGQYFDSRQTASEISTFNRFGEKDRVKITLDQSTRGDLLRQSALEERPEGHVLLAATALRLERDFAAEIAPAKSFASQVELG